MARSQNGLSANDRSVIRSATVPDTDVRVAVRKGPVGDLLLAAAARWNREVEPLRAPDGVLDCWGYAERTIRGSSTQLSNHASGSAADFRARAHPLGIPAAKNYTPAQIAAIHQIVDDAEGALRWGGDYDNPSRGGVRGSRPDPMHLEANASEARCAEVLPRFLARSGAAAAASVTPAPAPREDDDEMDIPITVHADGRFSAHKIAEAGGGGWFGDGLVSVGSAWGATRVWVTALGGDGYVWPLSDAKGDVIANNTTKPYTLPAGTRHVTLEGSVEHPPDADGFGTEPTAAWIAKRA